MLRGTCHMLSESGLKQKPINTSRTARQPDPSQRGGGEQRLRPGGCLCKCVFGVYTCFQVTLIFDMMVAVATLC